LASPGELTGVILAHAKEKRKGKLVAARVITRGDSQPVFIIALQSAKPTATRGLRLARALIVFTALAMPAAAFPAQAPDLAEKSHRAKELMDSGRAGDAVPIYRELVRAMPANAGLVMDLGLALDLSGSKQDAIRQYQAALKLDAGLVPALVMLGTAYSDLGQPAKAIEPLERALKIQPDNVDARETLAEALLTLGRLNEAEHHFREVARQDPSSSKAWYGLGLCYEGLAQQNFDSLAKVAPGSAYWLDLVAESRLETKQDYSAFYFYHQALAKMPEMRGIHAALAQVYQDTGHPDWAAIEEQKERQLPPLDCPAERSVQEPAQKPEPKLECDFQASNFSAIIATTEARTPEAYYWKTRAYNKLALDAYSHLGQLPPSTESHELEAKIDLQRRQYAESAKEWREALALSPGNRYIQTQLAIALYKTGDLKSAATLFRDLLQRQPDDPNLCFYLGDTILNAQDPQGAVKYLNAAVSRDPQLLLAQRSLGLAYLQIGQSALAIAHLQQALPIDEDGSLHYQLARAYQANGQRELAAPLLRQYQQMQQAKQAQNKGVEEKVAIAPPD
jgi:tetratricopeptide (TPR) repeat protein